MVMSSLSVSEQKEAGGEDSWFMLEKEKVALVQKQAYIYFWHNYFIILDDPP